METVNCSSCGRPLEALPRIVHFSDFDQWYGNVCTQCGRVYCNSCLEIGTPTPCPECGAPTQPAQRYYLRQAQVLA